VLPDRNVSGMVAFTHKWTQSLRSTGTFGYVHVDNTSIQVSLEL